MDARVEKPTKKKKKKAETKEHGVQGKGERTTAIYTRTAAGRLYSLTR
jgi:hypothetical protein